MSKDPRIDLKQLDFRLGVEKRAPGVYRLVQEDASDENNNAQNSSAKSIVMIDNYDSFTYNLVQYFGELGVKVSVFKNDEITLTEIEELDPRAIVISPGPCTPNEAGISLEVIRHFSDKLPLLGICLGHQSIGQVFAGKVVQAKKIMHGKLSKIYHHNRGVFTNLPNPFVATRYHSLVIENGSLPSSIEVTAWTQTRHNAFDEIMGIKHNTFPVEGVQFHPESILTEHGKDLLKNFLLTTRISDKDS
jgi:anthranilate synthase component II